MTEPNELYPELMSLTSLLPHAGSVSSGRTYMTAGNLGQSLPIAIPTERGVQSGMERQYAPYTNNIKMPADGRVLKIIELYPRNIGIKAIPESPSTLVIFETVENGMLDCIEITKYCYNYHYYGFAYQPMSGMQKLREGAFIPKDTIFMDSTAKTEDGAYRYGRDCNVAFMSHPAVAEDGIMICEDILPAFAYRTYERRVVSWGSDEFPINLYGDADNYKPFPDIGEYVESNTFHSGLLMATRKYDDYLSVIDQNITAVRYPDLQFDNCTYVNGPGGRVVDIRIFHDHNSKRDGVDRVMSEQVRRYDDARRRYYQEIIEVYKTHYKVQKDRLLLSPEFHRLVVEAISVVGSHQIAQDGNDKAEQYYRKKPLDEWRVEFTIEYYKLPNIGSKLSDTVGGKGVVCKIAKREEMPRDANGNVADIVFEANSTVSRMNIGRLFEQYLNAASRDVTLAIKQLLNVTGNEYNLLELISTRPPEVIDLVTNKLLSYYQIVSPRQYAIFTNGEYPLPFINHIAHVIQEGVQLWLPTDNEPEHMQYIGDIQSMHTPTYSPVTFKDSSGNLVTTIAPVRIGKVYFILLEKTGSDWSALSSGRLQQHGVLAPITAGSKHTTPIREQPPRSSGEAELRNFVSYVGPHYAADLLDRNNNPEVHREIVRQILAAPQPTNIERVIDRKLYPLGYSKPLQIIKHMALCSGYQFVYDPLTELSEQRRVF